jgi:Lipocalin-like domain
MIAVRTFELPFRENNMLRLIAFALAAYCYLQSGFAMADEAAKQLVGSWRLTSWVIQVVGGEATEPFGPNPKGRAVFTSDGFSAFMIARPDRKPATNDSDSAALLKSLMVYTGKFTVDGDKLTTNVDLSWNEILTGTAQIRFFKLEGDKLSIRTAEQVSAVYPGKKVVGTLTWERER